MSDVRMSVLEDVISAWRRVLDPGLSGPDDNFFACGGSSLAAAQLAADLSARSGLRVTMAQILKHPTPRAMAGLLVSGELAPARQEGPSPEPPLVAPATIQQEAIWFLEQLLPDNYAYNSLVLITLCGPLDTARLEAATHQLVRRHELLHSTFMTVDGQLVLRATAPPPPVPLVTVDMNGASTADVVRHARQLSWQPFTIDHPPLIRWVLLRRAPHQHVVAQIEHHFVHDGWSMWLLLTGLSELYRTGDRHQRLTDAGAYRRFAIEQRRWLSREQAARDLTDWVKFLGPYVPLTIPEADRRPRQFTFRGDTVHVRLDPDVSSAVRSLAKTCGATPFTIMLAAFCALISVQMMGQPFAVGTMLRNRPPGLELVVGMFVNTVALPVPPVGAWSFRHLVDHISGCLSWAVERDGTPFPLVVSALDPPRNESVNPIFHTCFSMNDWPNTQLDFGPDLTASVDYPSTGGAKFDLDVVVIPDGEGWLLLWRFYEALFDASDVRERAAWFSRLLLAAAESPARTVSSLAEEVGRYE